jgi:hypothetical protein
MALHNSRRNQKVRFAARVSSGILAALARIIHVGPTAYRRSTERVQ